MLKYRVKGIGKFKKIIMGLLLIPGFLACTHTPVIPAQPEVSFSKQVQPVIIANCTMSGCHNGVSSGGEDVFSLMNYSDITRRNMAIPGNAKSSRIYSAITGSGENAMPPNGAMSNDDILLIYLWIEQGAKNN
jgi:hypothetical protein